MRLDLNNPSVAQYYWSTLVCRFSAAAPAGKRTFLNAMAALSAGGANWNTEEEFRATAALLHEIVHLAQDLTTGIGHSDHLVHVAQDSQLLFLAPLVAGANGQPARTPYREESFVAEADNQLIYYPFALLGHERRERYRAILEKEFGRSVDDELLFDLSTQSILESDAAFTTISNLQRLAMNEDQFAILKKNLSLLDRTAMGPEYWKAFWHMEAVVSHHAAPDERQLELVLPTVFGFFVDCALACPPRDWILARHEDPDDFDPGIKYCRLLVAFQRLSGATMDRFWSAFIAKNLADVEAVLLEHANYSYPSSKEVYEAWLAAFEPLAPKSPVDEIRRAACRHRLDQGAFLIERGIDELYGMQAPIFFLHEGEGFVKNDWGIRVVDSQKSTDLTLALLDRLMVMDLVDFLFRTGEFRCPHAQTGTCSVAEDRCFAGFVDLAQFPETPQCFARATLARCGMQFATP